MNNVGGKRATQRTGKIRAERFETKGEKPSEKSAKHKRIARQTIPGKTPRRIAFDRTAESTQDKSKGEKLNEWREEANECPAGETSR